MTSGGPSVAQRAEIERIVRDVLAELSGTGRPAPHPAGGELVVSEKVVSANTLEDRIDGVTRVVVPRGAVITPAARDLLRERQVTIATAVTHGKQAAQKVRVVVGLAETNYEAASVVNMLSSEGAVVERLPQTGLLTVVDELCERVAKGGCFGLMVTPRTAAALCLANRRGGVRAALGANAAATADASDAIAANVLVVDPKGKAMFEWNRILRAWLQSGPRECPEQLRERLE